MKLLPALLAAMVATGAAGAHAQAIDASRPAVKLGPANAGNAPVPVISAGRSGLLKPVAKFAPNWTRVTASRRPDGTLQARCDVVHSPMVTAAQQRDTRTVTPARK
ncbi:MAG TPA: hypothetical protein VFG73_02680 [Rhodanobacteraceae bacterium]|nr:hypothetical protein [Rhodanobacteraceae bacterium]